MECGKWIPEDWQDLLHQLKRGRCILMLGPDASAEEIEGQWKPLTEQLSNRLHRELAPEIQREISPNNLAQTTLYYQQQHRRPAYLEAERFYEIKQGEHDIEVKDAKNDSLLVSTNKTFAPGKLYTLVLRGYYERKDGKGINCKLIEANPGVMFMDN